VIRRFGEDVLSVINTLYDEAVNPSGQEDAFRIFDTPDGLGGLHKSGWLIANHSAAHYPIGDAVLDGTVNDGFEECDRFVRGITGTESSDWVSPFGCNLEPAIAAGQTHGRERTVVLVGDRVNMTRAFRRSRLLYRIAAPANDRDGLWQVLLSASHRSRR